MRRRTNKFANFTEKDFKEANRISKETRGLSNITKYDLMSIEELEQLLGLDKCEPLQVTDNTISADNADAFDDWYREELIKLITK
jgi:hypothetical protein